MCFTVITSCSLFSGNNNNYPANSGDTTDIPLPPQKLSASNAALPANPGRIKAHVMASAPKRIASGAYTNTYPQQIQEERSNGTVTEIKVDNGGDLPDYYMYPSQQNNLDNNNNSDSNITTPSWQISW